MPFATGLIGTAQTLSPSLNDRQREAIERTSGPLLIVAGAGTGKTRVIIEKIGHLLQAVPSLRPENILALTFSDQAAAEMKQRAAERFGEAARHCRFSTFHAFCYQLLSETGGKKQLKAIDDIDHWIFLRRNLESLNLNHYFRVSEPGRFLEDLLAFCSQCHDNLVTPAVFSEYVETLARESSDPEEIAKQREVARVFTRSEELQDAAGVVSFGAMLSRAVELLTDSPALLDQLRRRYRFILVDEFQDTNWAQIELIRLLAGSEQNVTVVGDRKQAIYHFRGASHTSFDLFAQTFPRHARVVLNQNYRSTQRILTVAETAIAAGGEHYAASDRLKTANPPGAKVEVWEFATEDDEAEFLAREIGRRIRAGEAAKYSEFAVLYRAHSYRDRLVTALRRHKIPFAIRKLAINRLPAVLDLLAHLRAIGSPEDNISLLRTMAHPRWQISMAAIWKLCREARRQKLTLHQLAKMDSIESASDRKNVANLLEFLERYRTLALEQRLAQWLETLRSETGLFALSEEALEWKAFSDFAKRWDRDKTASGLLADFLEYFAYFEEANGSITLPDEEDAAQEVTDYYPKDRDAEKTAADRALPLQRRLWDESPEERAIVPQLQGKVQLMTMHAAKGLEFRHVFLLRMIRGAMPTRYQRPLISFPAALLKGPPPEGDLHSEEERRLFYVALTRAQTSLTLCTIANGKQRPSPFLNELREAKCPDLEWKEIAPTSQRAPRDFRCGASAVTARLAPSGDDPVLAGLSPETLSLTASALEAYIDCPMKYRFSYLCGIPTSPSAALRFGSIMHAAVKRLVAALANSPGSVDEQRIEAILQELWTPADFADPVQERKYWQMGLEQLRGVWRHAAEKPLELLGQEVGFEFRCGGVKVSGRIDQLNRLAPTEVEMIEYKTGRLQTQKEVDRDIQLTIYAQACEQALELRATSIVLYNLSSQESFRTRRGAADFRAIREKLAEASKNILNGELSPAPGYHCRYCDFRPICPAQEQNN